MPAHKHTNTQTHKYTNTHTQSERGKTGEQSIQDEPGTSCQRLLWIYKKDSEANLQISVCRMGQFEHQ